MNFYLKLLRRTAFALVRLSAWLLPSERSDWGAAMVADLHYIDGEVRAVWWSVGCVFASGKTAALCWISTEKWRLGMRRSIGNTLAGVTIFAVAAVSGTYAIQKPYQRERIAIWLHLEPAQKLAHGDTSG